MKKLILLFLLLLTISCSSTKYVTVPLTTPPKQYTVKKIENEKELIKEYQNLLKHSLEWYTWYNVQIGSNHYNNKPTTIK